MKRASKNHTWETRHWGRPIRDVSSEGRRESAAEAPSQQMSVSQEISDAVELIDQLRARFHQPKVYLVGFSYGTYLGILLAQRVPERLYAYVGIGQLACSDPENRAIQNTWIRERATRDYDQETIDELDGKKPFDREKWLFKYGGEIHSATNWWPLLWSGLRSSEYTFRDIANVKRGVDLRRIPCGMMSSTAQSWKM